MAKETLGVASHVLMVRPHKFYVNGQTATDNAFQSNAVQCADLAALAHAEVTQAIHRLEQAGVAVSAFEDYGSADTPDSVFPNNWLTTHHDGTLVLYPMYAKNRRKERRRDIVDYLTAEHGIRCVIDFSLHERAGRYLEGTGALVLDHVNAMAYCALSNRASHSLFHDWCGKLGYHPVSFHAQTSDRKPVYHTNVMMALGPNLGVVCLEAITTASERMRVARAIKRGGRELLAISEAQMRAYAGNLLALRSNKGQPLWVMSETAWAAFEPHQQAQLEATGDITCLRIPTIELAGGSARCMLAEILPVETKNPA
ncbi:MAG: amidinotransferase [Idiomarina sp.]|nr:amidinotransferase [Idiomarina sp.]